MKVLIWDKDIPLRNTGGPSGYLYNIHNYLTSHPNKEIDFYSDLKDDKRENNVSKEFGKKSFTEYLLSQRFLKFVYYLYATYYKKTEIEREDVELLDKYDYVHVHTFTQYMMLFSNNSNLRCKVILTTHCPEPCFDEICGNFQYGCFFKLLPMLRNFFIRKECLEIKKADFVLLPVKEATDAYTSASKYYLELFNEIHKKLIFVPTAIYPSEKVLTKEDPTNVVSIDDDTLRICFIGRHNKIKGYDQLKIIAKEVESRGINAHFFVGGKESPLKGLKSSCWTELGWVNTMEVLNNVDVFILPNKQTYFDLILVEVLRQGNVCIISRTGGNKWFEQFDNTGIFLYDYGDFEKMIELINFIISIKKEKKLSLLEKNNRKVFEDHLVMNKYVEAYCHILNSLK